MILEGIQIFYSFLYHSFFFNFLAVPLGNNKKDATNAVGALSLMGIGFFISDIIPRQRGAVPLHNLGAAGCVCAIDTDRELPVFAATNRTFPRVYTT